MSDFYQIFAFLVELFSFKISETDHAMKLAQALFNLYSIFILSWKLSVTVLCYWMTKANFMDLHNNVIHVQNHKRVKRQVLIGSINSSNLLNANWYGDSLHFCESISQNSTIAAVKLPNILHNFIRVSEWIRALLIHLGYILSYLGLLHGNTVQYSVQWLCGFQALSNAVTGPKRSRKGLCHVTNLG